MGRVLREMVIIAVAALAGIYLINPTFGVFELIPDNIPLVGNMDEAGATLILLNTLRYYGLDLTGLGKRREQQLPPPPQRKP